MEKKDLLIHYFFVSIKSFNLYYLYHNHKEKQTFITISKRKVGEFNKRQ